MTKLEKRIKELENQRSTALRNYETIRVENIQLAERGRAAEQLLERCLYTGAMTAYQLDLLEGEIKDFIGCSTRQDQAVSSPGPVEVYGQPVECVPVTVQATCPKCHRQVEDWDDPIHPCSSYETEEATQDKCASGFAHDWYPVPGMRLRCYNCTDVRQVTSNEGDK